MPSDLIKYDPKVGATVSTRFIRIKSGKALITTVVSNTMMMNLLIRNYLSAGTRPEAYPSRMSNIPLADEATTNGQNLGRVSATKRLVPSD